MARKVGAVLLGLGLVVGGLEVGAAGVPRAEAGTAPPSYWGESGMPQYPAMEFPLGEGLAVNGVPVRISYFEARANADEVRDFYAKEFEARGLVSSVDRGADDGWTVTALAEDGRGEIVVAIMGRGAQRSLVFPALVPFDATGAALDDPGLDLPSSPQAIGRMVVSAKDKPGEAVVTYQEPAVEALRTAGRIRDEEARQGWSLERFGASPGKVKGYVVEVRKGPVRRHFTVTQWPGREVGAAVMVEITKVQ